MRGKGALFVAAALVASLLCGVAPAAAGEPGPPGSGYWMLDADGNVFAFGAAPFCGSPSESGEVWGSDIVPTPDGFGYWTLDARGAVFFMPCDGMSDAHYNTYHGDEYFEDRLDPDEFAMSMSPTPDGGGYWVFTDIGRVLAFGNAAFRGSLLECPSTARSSIPSRLRPATVTGWSAPTAASSPSATRSSTARWVACA